MADQIVTTNAFREKLLAPLPAEEEQPTSPRFMRKLRADASAAWYRGMRRVYLTKYHRDYCGMADAMRNDGDMAPTVDKEAAQYAYYLAVDAQMRMPASCKSNVDWKVKHKGFGGGHPDWEAAVEADRRRLAI